MLPSTFYVRGVAYRLSALAKLAEAVSSGREYRVDLIAVTGNPHDENAVRVDAQVRGERTITVGWVPRECNQYLRKMMGNMGVWQIPAKVERVELDGGIVSGAVLVLKVELPEFLPKQGRVSQ